MRERNISQTVRSAGVAVLLLLPLILFGCSSMNQGAQARQLLAEANDLFIQGEYATSLDRYAQLLESHPDAKDRILFEMGIIYAHPKNEQKDYPQAVASFQQLIREHPESDYRQDSEMMLFYLDNVVAKDGIIAAQQARIEALQKEVAARESDNKELSGRIKLLEQKYFNLALQHGPVDKILIEKQARRLTLILKGEVLKAYKIALGGNPVGAMES
jgi:tetratricopeptide (TPR) repeat protein